MEKRFMSFIILITALLLSGCSLADLPFLNKIDINSKVYSESDLEFQVEKVLLSKGYQNTEPRVELISKLDENRLLIFPGLVKSSGMEVSDISVKDDVVSISIVNSSYSSAELVIPQISILITSSNSKSLEKLSFNIINENYKPLKLNYGIVDVLNKVEADYKVSTDSYPNISLIEKDSMLLWKIDYDNIFDLENKEIPIIDLELLVNSSNGEVLMSKKSLISTLIDEGEVLCVDQDFGFLYTKKQVENNLPTNEIWFYDFLDNTKKKIYTSQFEISLARLRPNEAMSIAFIEKKDDYAVPYIIDLEDKRVTKIVLPENQMPEQISWKTEDELSILTSYKANQSNIFIYNLRDNSLRTGLNAVFDIASFSQLDEKILLSEYVDNLKNNKIKLWVQGKGFVFIGNGYSPQIINNDFGVYIEKDEGSEMESLHIINLNTLEEDFAISNTIKSYKIISENEIYITENSDGNSCYKTSILNIEEKELYEIGNINSAKSYYHKETELVYLNLAIPFAENAQKIIFSIPKEELKRR